MKRLILFSFLTLSAFFTFGQDGTSDNSFAIGTGFNQNVQSIALQPDGKILVGGAFTSFNETGTNYIARLNSDGTLDNSFTIETGFNIVVHSIALQLDGKILVGGSFTSFNGTVRNRIVRLNSNGTLDNSFTIGTGFDFPVQSIALQADGKILVGGWFTSFNGTVRNRIVRLNSNGTLDNSFTIGTGFNNVVYSIALQPDGKILVGGEFTSFNGTVRNRIVRLNSDGTLDTNFDPGAGFNTGVSSIALQPDGKILVGGWFTSFNGTEKNRIVRLNSNGTLDTNFDPGSGFNNLNNGVRSIALQSDGKILLGGRFTSFNGTGTNFIARLNSNGTLDTNFDPGVGFNTEVWSIALQPDGKILVGGDFTSFSGTATKYIVRLNNCIPVSGTDTRTECSPYTWIDNIIYTTSNNTATHTIVGGASNGCDSIVTLNLTINSTYNVQTEIACENYTWNGTTYNASGTKLYNYTNGNGCPSTDTLHLTINNGTHNVQTETACESYIWNGTTYNTSGTKLYNYTNGSGCPSTDTLHLTINSTYNVETETACESYTWNGTTYNTSGTKLYNYTNGNGCPSTDTLHLTINNGTHNVQTETACESYTWNGTIYNASGTKLYNYMNGSGCPSTDTLHLTITSVDASISESGITLTANLSGATYQWIDCDDNNSPIIGETAQTFTALQNGNYAVEITINSCTKTSECIVVAMVGINEFGKNNMCKIYPNPTENTVFIQSETAFSTVELKDLNGKLIYSQDVNSTKTSIDISKLNAGVYLIEVTSETAKYVERVVKQ